MLLSSYFTVPSELWTVEIKHFGPVFSVHCPVVASALNLTRAEREPGCVQLKTADLQMRNCNCNDSSTKAHKACPFRPILPAPYNGRDDSYICIMSTFQANQQQAHQIRLFQGARCTFFLQIVSLIHTVVIIVWTRMPEYKRFQFLF